MRRVFKSRREFFTGTYRKIYIDRLYASIDLLRELYEMLLFSMGTCINNSTPKELKMTKRSLYYK